MKKLIVMLVVGLFPVIAHAYMDPSNSLDPDGTAAANDIEKRCGVYPDSNEKTFRAYAVCIKNNFNPHIMKPAVFKKTKLEKDICLSEKKLDKMRMKSSMGVTEFYANYPSAREETSRLKQVRLEYQRLTGRSFLGYEYECTNTEFKKKMYDFTITDFYRNTSEFYRGKETK